MKQIIKKPAQLLLGHFSILASKLFANPNSSSSRDSCHISFSKETFIAITRAYGLSLVRGWIVLLVQIYLSWAHGRFIVAAELVKLHRCKEFRSISGAVHKGDRIKKNESRSQISLTKLSMRLNVDFEV